MKIVILNGKLNSKNDDFQSYIEAFVHNFSDKCEIEHIKLSELDLSACTGCWSCWWKTPGRCAVKDDAETVFKSVINADFVLFASPLSAGFTSSLLKLITDRLIVLLHPYIQMIHKESHHRKRYDHYPKIGLLLEKEPDTNQEDIEIISDIYKRLAINFHSELVFVKLIDEHNMEDVFYETCNI